MNTSPDFARSRLASAARQKTRSQRLAWALWTAGLGVLALLGLAWFDYWFILPAAIRITGALGLAGLLVFWMGRGFRLWRRPATLKDAALDLEAIRPELGCVVSTAAEYLSGERPVTQAYEPELVAALEDQAARKLKYLPISYLHTLWPSASVLGAALLGLLIFSAVVPVALVALSRAALPWSQSAYSQVQVDPGNVDIPVGKDLAIAAIFSGRPLKEARFYWRHSPAAPWQSIPMATTNRTGFTRLLTNVQASFMYQITGNDAQSPLYRVATYVPPVPRELRVRIDYPPYTQLEPAEQREPDIRALRGSRLTMVMTPSTKLSRATLQFTNSTTAFTPAGSNLWTASLVVAKDQDYHLKLEDTRGHLGMNEQPYHIKAIPDEPPRVEIVQPGQDTRADATNRVPVKISVADDFGVAEVKLVYHKLNGPEKSMICPKGVWKDNEMTVTAELDLAALDLKDYELVAYHAEAKDNNTLDGPGLGRSPVYFIEITNEEGAPCKSQCQGQKVNLLVIQKQIIADTLALPGNAGNDKYQELAARESDAVDFGRIYLAALNGLSAPAEVVQHMESAIQAMERATNALVRNERQTALPSEEEALARFYQILKLLPEMQDLPIQPPAEGMAGAPANPALKVVLEAIKKRQKESPDNQQLLEILSQAKQLSRDQSALNQFCQNPGQKSGNSASAASGDENREANASETGLEAVQKAETQRQLAQATQDMAGKLARLAGKDNRVGHNLSKSAHDAAQQMNNAAQALRQGNLRNAFTGGWQGTMALNSLIANLEYLLKDRVALADVSKEDYPPEYEAWIAEYLRRLSYAE